MAIRRGLRGRGIGGRQPRRLTDWEYTVEQSTPTATLSGITTAQILFNRAILDSLGNRATLTRMLMSVNVAPQTGGTPTSVNDTVHMLIMVTELDEMANLRTINPTTGFDLNSGGVLWQRQVMMANATGEGGVLAGFAEFVDIKAQRKLREQQVIVFVVEPNGVAVNHFVQGRALFKLH